MSGMVEVLNRAAAAWWEWTVASTGQGALLLLFVVVILAAGRSLRPGFRYGLLLVVLLKFAVPPVFGVAYGFSDLLARAFTNEPAPLVNSDLRVTVETSPALATPSPTVPVATFRPHAPVLSPKAWLLLLEAAGAAVIVFLIARQCLVARTLIWNGTAAEETLQERFHAMVRALKLRRTPRLRLSEAAGAPQSGGILRPFVILPAWAAAMPEEELDILLAHELAHIRRMDALVNGSQAAAQALLWWNPAVWWLNHRIREEREFCCDDLVLSRGIASGAAYSRTLVNVAERVSLPQSSWAMAGMADNFGAIDRRVRRALEGGQEQNKWGRYGALLVLALLAGWVLPGATDGEEKEFDAARAAEVEGVFRIRDLTAEKSGLNNDGALTRWGKLTFRVDAATEGKASLEVKGTGELLYPQGLERTTMVMVGEVQGAYRDLSITAKRLAIDTNGMIEFFDATTHGASLENMNAARLILDLQNGAFQLEAGRSEKIGINNATVKDSPGVPQVGTGQRALRISTSILEVSADADVLPDHEMKLQEHGENFHLLGGGVAEQWEAFERACRQAVENGQAKFIARPTLQTLAEESASISIGKQVTSLEDAPKDSALLPVTTVRATPVMGTEGDGGGSISVEVEIERGLPKVSGVEGASGEKDLTKFVIAPDEMDGDWRYHVTRRDGGALVVVVLRVTSVDGDQRNSG